MAMNGRQFTQATAITLGSSLVAKTLSAAKIDSRALNSSNLGPGDWRMVPAALSRFDWHKTIARPSSSPGLTNQLVYSGPESRVEGNRSVVL